MKRSNFALLFLFCALPATAAERFYQFSVDQDKPIRFSGTNLCFSGNFPDPAGSPASPNV